MAYRNFKFIDLEEKFGIKQTKASLFNFEIKPVEPSAFLLESMNLSKSIPLTTEKIVSEALVFPVLREIKMNNKEFIELYSGENLDADKHNGLNGECDFIFTKSPDSVEIKAPIIQVIETKQGEISRPKPLAQVSAQLIGTRFFNQKQEKPTEPLYGVCTSGFEWLFLKLEGSFIVIDTQPFFISDLPRLLGGFQYIIDLSR